MRRMLALALALLVLLGVRPALARAAGAALRVDFFFMEPCGSCNTEQELQERFLKAAREAAPDADFELVMHNTVRNEENALLTARYDALSLPVAQRPNEALFCGERAVLGLPADEELAAFVKELAAAPPPELQLWQGPAQRDGDAFVRSTGGAVLVYFYVTGCQDCARVDGVLRALPDTVRQQRYNVGEGENLALLRRYFERYGVAPGRQTTPIVFVGDEVLAAEEIDARAIAGALATGQGTLLPSGGPTGTFLTLPALQYGGVFLTGLLNGLNPCGMSMLLFLLMLLGTRRALRNGLMFLLGKCAAYYAIGTFGYRFFLAAGESFLPGLRMGVQLALAAAALAVGALHISDALAAKQERYGKIRLQMPLALRKAFHGLMKRVADRPAYLGIGCLVVGVVISGGEFLCTGQITLASIVYAVQNVGGAQAQSFFATYVAATVLPSLALLLLLCRGKSSFQLSEALRRNMPRVKLAAGLFFVAIAVYFAVTAL